MSTLNPFIDKKLVGKPVEIGKSADRYQDCLMEGEEVIMEYKGLRDAVVFTEKRLIVIDPQGIRGRKVSIASIPWKTITAYSIENSGTLDLDAELKICGSGFGVIELEFFKGANMKKINNFINEKVFG